MNALKKFGKWLLRVIGYLLMGVGGLGAITSAFTALYMLFSRKMNVGLGERITLFLISLLFAAVSVGICWCGRKLKKTFRRKDDLDDVTFIQDLKHIPAGSWHQYDVLLAARGYGWDMMINWADYMASADLEHISQVTTGQTGVQEQDITESYKKSNGKCSETPELKQERGFLSVAGISNVLKAPMKIVWINQTKVLRFFTTVDNEVRIRKYAETVIRRTFGTKNAMKLGKPIPARDHTAPTPVKSAAGNKPVKAPVRDAAIPTVDTLLKTVNEMEKQDPKPEAALRLAHEKLAKELWKLENLYVFYDEDFNPQFPFVDSDGRMAFFTTKERAENARNFYQNQHLGHVRIKTIPSKDYLRLFKEFRDNGFCLLRVDNGFAPVELKLSELYDIPVDTSLLDLENRNLRYLFIRDLQYGYRIRKLDPSQKGSTQEKGLTESMLTMQANAYQTLSRSLLYVFSPGPRENGVTFYTPKAMEQAKELLQERGLPEAALRAVGSDCVKIYDGPLNLRITVKPGQQALQDSFCCAFTESGSANKVLESFAKAGCDDNLLVITYDELQTQAVQCAGILLDMPTYGLEISKAEFEKINMYRIIPGGIVVTVQDGDAQDTPGDPISGTLRASSPKYQTIESAIKLLEQQGFVLQRISTWGETSSHMWCVGFKKEYDTFQAFTENVYADYRSAASESGSGPNLEWASTSFRLVNADNVLVSISIEENDGESSPSTAKFHIWIPEAFPPEKKAEIKRIRNALAALEPQSH